MPNAEPITDAPLYRKIYDDLAGKITSGEIGYKERLPALPELCGLYGVSEAPVRRALEELERANFVMRQRGRGKGTIAVRPPTALRLRLLLMDDLDSGRGPMELYHEIYDLIAGIRSAAAERDIAVQSVSQRGYDSLPAPGADTGYLIIAQGGRGYAEGAAMASRQGAPYVLVNSPGASEPCVRVEMQQGAFLGVSHLTSLGHRRIGYVGSASGDWFGPRLAGYRDALALCGVRPDPELIIETGGVEPREDEEALDRLLALPSPPTAIFACSDYRALHLLNHCRRRGIAVPEQLSLCGYDDVEEAAAVEPALTTVRHPRYELGKAAVVLLSELISGDVPASLDVVVSPRLAVRASCAAPDISVVATRASLSHQGLLAVSFPSRASGAER